MGRFLLTGAVTVPLVLVALACSKASLTTVETAADQAAAQGCDMLFLPTDPALAPLCVGIADVVAAGAALGLDLLGGGGADAGAIDGGGLAPRTAGAYRVTVRDPATNARVYAWLVAHGATPLGG
jgi:hypothetical protein